MSTETMSIKAASNERLRDNNNYGIYCVNIFGSGLNAIKNEFKRQVSTGLRLNVYVLDIDDIQNELHQPDDGKIGKQLTESRNTYLFNSILQRIQKFRKDYELITKKINEELKFDLYQYWLKHNGQNIKSIADKSRKTSLSKQSKEIKALQEKYKISCSSSLIAEEHNKQGQSKNLSKKKHIKDEPVMDKLYIIILGDMSKLFYADLLSLGQPLDGIINFIPTESQYDIMLGNNKLRNFIGSTLEAINYSTYTLRQQNDFKPVGLFTLELPVISSYLAAKHSREIFDQLTWSIYDIDMLKQQYENYYLKPFQLTNVEIPASDNLTELYHLAETLSMKGQFEESLLPASDADLASIACYLNCLLNTCALEENPMRSFLNKFPNSFATITNISKYDRLVVAENNKLLLNMLQYTDLDKFHSVYSCCLDYNIVGQYAISQPHNSKLISPNGGSENLHANSSLTLPRYVKYYANKDCTCQRITELLKDYDEFEIQYISVGNKLYTFKRKYYVVIENEGSIVIPTRLCFRDFTLFNRKEFLNDLQISKPDSSSQTAIRNSVKESDITDLNENIFIKPNSLKSVELQADRINEGRKSRKTESHARKSKREKKSSVDTSINSDAHNQGLPPQHHLLKGYNLDDTLQEVKYKTSKYYFHHGFVKLYEEKLCFQDLNKQLSLCISKATFFFSSPRTHIKGISNNIRLITENNTSIRILNDVNEKSKIVMNYPNGLNVAHNDDFCEQTWYCEQTPHNEQSRKFTHCGAVIVFFRSQDMITILRYNGEVYRLYQHDLAEEGQEQDDIDLYGDIETRSSDLEDVISQGDSLLAQEASHSGHLKNKTSRTKKPSMTFSVEGKSSIETKSNLISSIYDELRFLNSICSLYDLTYLHAVVTTSQGKCANLTRQGKISEGHHLFINEWHDYFANEAYCERSDGVKMIWSKNAFKCFHEDGTIFTTTIEADLSQVDDDDDEFESQISESSSHLGYLEETKDCEKFLSQQVLEQSTQGKMVPTVKSTNTSTEFMPEHKASYIPFVRYKCKSWIIQHQNYAKVYLLKCNFPTSNTQMEIFGRDNIRIYTQFEQNNENNFEDYDYSRTESEEYRAERENKKLLVHVWIGAGLHVKADKESCNINAVVPNSKSERETKSDSFSLSLRYTDCISDAFKYFVNEVASVVNRTEQELEELYFIEKANTDCSIRGFEFFNSLPITSDYKLNVGNTIIEIRPVNNINKPVVCNCVEDKNDVKKFPRFKQHPQENTAYEFPRFLSANVFIEIPKQLLSLTNVTKFLEPFEDLHFKRLRGKFKNILSFYLEPQQQFYLKRLTSEKNWKKRLCEHKRSIFAEKQRLGLYNVMAKHNIYPNYWEFKKTYGNNVRHINFFNFMQNQCCRNEHIAISQYKK